VNFWRAGDFFIREAFFFEIFLREAFFPNFVAYLYNRVNNHTFQDMDELHWGILGCGRIANDFARAMRNCQHKNRVSFRSIFGNFGRIFEDCLRLD
jgi:hypothetical protein